MITSITPTNDNPKTWKTGLVRHPILVLSVFPVIGMLILYWSMERWGISCSFDTSAYLLTAENFLQGKGVDILLSTGKVIPQMHYPPLYSMFLSVFMWMGMDRLAAPMCLSVILFGANISMVSLIVYDNTRSPRFAVLASFLALTSNILVYIHTIAMSEALFIFLGLSGIHFTVSYARKRKPSHLIFGAICYALAFLTRHAGLAFIAAGALTILIYDRHRIKKAVRDSLFLTTLGIAPTLLWILVHLSSFTAYLESGGRTIKWHMLGLTRPLSLANTAVQWLLPGKVPFQIRMIFATALLTTAMYILISYRKILRKVISECLNDADSAVFTAFAGFLLFYAALLLFSILLVDAFIPLDTRILSPAYVAFLVLALCLLNKIPAKTWRKPLFRCLIIGGIACFSLVSTVRSINYLLILRENGGGCTRAELRNSRIIAYLRTLPENTVVYANDPAPIYLLTGKRADFLPNKKSPFTKTPNPNFRKQMETLENQLEKKSAVVVCFKDGVHKFMTGYCIKEAELRTEISLKNILKTRDGNVYVRR
ncbi:MAG: glycosyltransferase family 39 protein [Kiritimatiellaeota bacterium]|nr:glycosyltransferase family 39 protein [Kiritimatiellota bacterium]